MMKLSLTFLALMNLSCLRQYDPTPHWDQAKKEESIANKPQLELTDKFAIPSDGSDGPVLSEVDKKYNSLCAGCHGANGGGDGPLAANIKDAKVRNFITWAKEDPNVTDEYIAKVIREGGVSVGKSAQMAAWGGVLNEALLKEMVAKVRSFGNPKS